jgi:hypothetical protein
VDDPVIQPTIDEYTVGRAHAAHTYETTSTRRVLAAHRAATAASASAASASGSGNSARGLTSQQYDEGGALDGYMSVREADAAGLTANPRITVLWDVVDGGDWKGGDPRQCTSTGE